MMKRVMALVLCLVLVVGMLPQMAFAASSGSCGANVTWKLVNGTLTISGEGEMMGYPWSGAPWYRSSSSIKTVVIEDGVTSIGDYAFNKCGSLTTVTIPDSVTSIENGAFSSCTALTTVTIPNSVTSIGDEAFSHCGGLTSIVVDANNPEYSSLDGNLYNKDQTTLIQYALGKTGEFTIPDSVTRIGDYAFSDCDSLTEVVIPDSVTSIGNCTFMGCSSLNSVTIGDGVTRIGYYAFYDCDSLVTVVIPDSVTSILNSAFYECESLTSITIPNSVTSIGERAFRHCGGLTNIVVDANNPEYSSLDGNLYNKDQTTLIQYAPGKTGEFTIPDSVTRIGDYAFSDCYSLTKVTIPDSVTSIGKYAFSDCYSLTEVVIPDSVTSIEYGAFYECNVLTDVYYNGDETDRGNISIGVNNGPLTNATWHYPEHYEISVLDTQNGCMTTDRSKTIEGKTVTLSAEADTGYALVHFLVDGAAIEGNTFIMPAHAVTVGAEFIPIDYTVTTKQSEHGSFTADRAIANIGNVVTLTASPEDGYEVNYFVNGKAITGNTFTMPAGDVTVTAEFTKIYYPITVEQANNGKISASEERAVFDTEIVLNATADTGYQLVSFLVNGVAISGSSFLMPKNAVTVGAEFALVGYAVRAGACENGSVSMDKETANMGETVTVTASPDAGYELVKILVNGKAITGNTFAMPAEDVTVTAEFTKIYYPITVEQVNNGKISASEASAVFDTEIVLSATADTGYQLVSFLVNGVAISGSSFLMPKNAVTVGAEFAPIDYTVTVVKTTGGSVALDKDVANMGETVTVTASPDAGYELVKILVNGKAIEGASFTMPAGDVTVSAEFTKIYYPITVEQANNGKVSASETSAVFDTEIVLSATADAGYRFLCFQVDGAAIEGNTFIMPKNAVTVGAEFVPIDYTVTTKQSEHGSFTTDRAVANIGNVITLTASPEDGYEANYFVNGKAIEGNTFAMPAEDVVVTAEFTKIQYPIVLEQSEQGVLSCEKEAAGFDEVVTITATPAAGYTFLRLKVNGVEIFGNAFVMPKEAVTVRAEYGAIGYAVRVGTVENGRVIVDKVSAHVGEQVNVTATADAGYELSKILVNGAAITGSSFAMPAEDVTVTAKFVKKQYRITTVKPENGVVMVDKETAGFDDVVHVTTIPGIGYILSKIKVNGEAIKGNSFVMPKCDVTVTAEFRLPNALGDIDGDEDVDVYDAVLLFQHSMLPEIYPIDYPGSVDFDRDGVVDVYDAVLLFQHSMLPDLYPIG